MYVTVPPDWSSYRSRVALRHGIRLRNDGGGYNRGATHPINAMLNYAYAVLIAQTQIRLIVEGYDPTIGIMHEKKALRGINPGFALDHMEPMRPVVDRAVLQLIDTVTFTGADFSIQHDGVCRMNPELARRVAQLALERCAAAGDRVSTCDPATLQGIFLKQVTHPNPKGAWLQEFVHDLNGVVGSVCDSEAGQIRALVGEVSSKYPERYRASSDLTVRVERRI